MREILFRGKRPHYESWVEGFYIHAPSGRLGKNEHLIQTVKKDGRLDILYEVYPETVGQFTGLLDKNGKRIFEGDIVTYCWYEVEPMNFCVDFVPGEFLAVPIKKLDGVWAIRISGTNKKMEVIGNIHDNPELLEGGDNRGT